MFGSRIIILALFILITLISAYTQSSGMKFSTKDVDNDNFCVYTKKQVRGQWIPEFSADDQAAKCNAAADHEDVYRDWETNADFKAWGSCAGQIR